MSRNRIIYNVQDLFFGLPSGETSELSGYHILRRINRVQSVNYDFNISRTDIGVLGKTQNIARPIIEPPSISLDFSYFLEGVTNERRIGFNVDNQNESNKPLFVKNLFDSSRGLDSRNIYLVTNNLSDLDIRGQSDSYEAAYLSAEPSEKASLIIDNNSPGYGILAFQNAYVSNYSVDISVGNIPQVNVSCVADNVIYFPSGSGVSVPLLNTKDGTSYDGGAKILIPKHFKEKAPNVEFGSLTFRPGNITVDIQKQTSTGINFHTETLQSFSLELPLDRENISYLGYKLYADRPIKLPIKSSLKLGFLDKQSLSGSLFSEINRDESYNFVVNCKKDNGDVGLRYLVSGAKFESVSHSSSVGDNFNSEMSFSVEMDLDDYKNGIFVSGQHVSITGFIEDDSGNELLDEYDQAIHYEFFPNF